MPYLQPPRSVYITEITRLIIRILSPPPAGRYVPSYKWHIATAAHMYNKEINKQNINDIFTV
jgi:hypothetical protein